MNISLLMSIGRCSLCECVNAAYINISFFCFSFVSRYFLNKFFFWFSFFCLVWNNLLVPGAQRPMT